VEQVADADLGTRLMGHQRAVESREREMGEMIGFVACGVDAEDEPQSDEALAAVDRVILATTVRVSAANYIPCRGHGWRGTR
jgi:hypothetical protein